MTGGLSINKRGLGFGVAMLSAITWGTNGTFCLLLGKMGLNTANVALLAPLFNFIFFFSILLLTNRRGLAISLGAFILLIMDGLCASLVNVAYVKSVSYFPVGIVSTLVFCNIFVIMFMARIFFKIEITAPKIISSIAAILGVGLVLNVFGGGVNLHYTGLIWVLLTIVSWSTMVTIEKYLLQKGVDGRTILGYTALFAVLTLSFYSPPWQLAGNIADAYRNSGVSLLFTILGYGLIPQVACYFLYITGLKYIDPSYIQVAYTLDPVTASFLGFLAFGQTLGITQVLGILLILVVVGYIQVKESREGAKENEVGKQTVPG